MSDRIGRSALRLRSRFSDSVRNLALPSLAQLLLRVGKFSSKSRARFRLRLKLLYLLAQVVPLTEPLNGCLSSIVENIALALGKTDDGFLELLDVVLVDVEFLRERALLLGTGAA